MKTITLYYGSILEVKADVLVNPANSFMRHGGGLAAVIDACAMGSSNNSYTREDWSERERQLVLMPLVSEYLKHRSSAPLIPVGGAILGPPGGLARRFNRIAHAVGPIWGDGQMWERELLWSAFDSAVGVTEAAGYESLVFPAIGAGVFGCPIEKVAKEALLVAANTTLDVTIAVTAAEHFAAFREAGERVPSAEIALRGPLTHIDRLGPA